MGADASCDWLVPRRRVWWIGPPSTMRTIWAEVTMDRWVMSGRKFWMCMLSQLNPGRGALVGRHCGGQQHSE